MRKPILPTHALLSCRVVPMALVSAACIAGSLAVRAEDHASSLASAPAAAERPFLAENSAAMSKMMADMNVKPTGNVDADFVAMMIPHHQGAIDMALAVLRYGKNEQIRRIAQEIVVDQQQEIAAMRLALDQPLPPSAPTPTQPGASAKAMEMSSTAHMKMESAR